MLKKLILLLFLIGIMFYMANKTNNEHIIQRRAQIINTAPFHSSPDNIHSGKNFTFIRKTEDENIFSKE